MSKPYNSLTIHPTTRIIGDVTFEAPFLVHPGCLLNNFRGGAFSYIAPGSLMAKTSIGRYCSIGNGVSILTQHPVGSLTTSPFAYEPLFAAPFDAPAQYTYDDLDFTHIGNDVWIGAGTQIKTGVTIGDGAVIGAGSVVTKDVAPFSIVGGVAAKPIRMRFSDAIIERIQKLQWWNYNLIGQQVDFRDPAAALDTIEAMIESGALQPYVAESFRIQLENGKYFLRPVDNAAGEPALKA